MNRKTTHVFLPLLVLFFLFSVLHAQIFQQFHAYDPGTGTETGPYHDVAALTAPGPLGEFSVSIGESFSFTNDALLSFNDINGLPLLHQEWFEPTGSPIQGKAIDEMPSGDLIVAFFDAGAGATDVVRIAPGGGPIWGVRIPDFRVQDIESDQAPYAGGEGIWLTGHSMGNNWLSVVGLDGGGGLIFNNEYFLNDPAWNYASTQGFEIDFDPFVQELVVVGTGQIAGLAQTTMLYLRLDLGGGWILGRAYSDPAGNDYYHGKALTPHPFNPTHYVVTFEYSAIASQPFDHLGICELDQAGNVLWMYHYPPFGGLAAGTNYLTNGVRSEFGGILMTCGSYNSFTAPSASSGYTFAFDPNGMPVQFNEYELNSPWYPSSQNLFWGMDFSPIFNSHVLAGGYATTGGGGGWPFNPNGAFWLVGTDPVGNSVCYNSDILPPNPLGPIDPFLSPFKNPLPPLQPVRVRPRIVDQTNTDQCSFPKRHFAEESEAESNSSLSLMHNSDGTIAVEIVGEITGEGQISVVDLNGKQLMQLEVRPGKQQLSTELLSSGIYFLRYQIPGIGSGAEKFTVR